MLIQKAKDVVTAGDGDIDAIVITGDFVKNHFRLEGLTKKEKFYQMKQVW